MENVVFTQLSIPELRKLFRQELEAFHETKIESQVRQPISQHLQKPFLKKREAAEILSVCASTIDNYARDGQLRRHYVGGAVRFDREQVLQLARTHQSNSRKLNAAITENQRRRA